MTRRYVVSVGVALTVLACVLAGLATPAVAQPSTDYESLDAPVTADHADPDPAFAVAIDAEGNADVHVTYAFELADQDRRAAFQELRDNETATAAFESRFAERMATVAADAAAATGRETSVEGVDVAFRTVENTGVVEVSVDWNGLAAVDGDRLVVTEPFASGFEADRPVHLRGPAGSAVTSATPSPDSADGAWHEWAAGTDLSGFEVVLESTGDANGGDGATDGGIGPGFGAVAALLGVLAALTVARGVR